MLIPQTLPTLPTAAQVRTRRPLSGVLANGLALGPLHAHLARHRPCVTHVVEGPAAQWALALSWAAHWEQPARVLVPLSDRARWLAVAVQHQAEGAGAQLAVLLLSLAGPVLDATQIGVESTREDGLSWSTYRTAWSSTPPIRDLAAPSRLLRVPDGAAGSTLVLQVQSLLGAPSGARPLTVTVYELPEEDEVP